MNKPLIYFLLMISTEGKLFKLHLWTQEINQLQCYLFVEIRKKKMMLSIIALIQNLSEILGQMNGSVEEGHIGFEGYFGWRNC